MATMTNKTFGWGIAVVTVLVILCIAQCVVLIVIASSPDGPLVLSDPPSANELIRLALNKTGLIATKEVAPLRAYSIGEILWIVALGGGIGGTVRALGSLVGYIARKELTLYWLCWYTLRPTQGPPLALTVMFLFKSGVLKELEGVPATSSIEMFYYGGIGFVVGLYSELVISRIEDLLERVFGAAKKPFIGRSASGSSVSPQSLLHACTESWSGTLAANGLTYVAKVATAYGKKLPTATNLRELFAGFSDPRTAGSFAAVTDGVSAQSLASVGRFVVGGFEDANNQGQVFIVIPGPKIPTAEMPLVASDGLPVSGGTIKTLVPEDKLGSVKYFEVI